MRISYSFLVRWLVLLCLLPSFGLFAQTTVTVGTGTTSTTNVPITAFYDYSYAQMIYEGNDLVNAGWTSGGALITKIRFNVRTGISAANAAFINNWTVYIGNTSKTTFASANLSEFVGVANMQTVFSGLVTYPSAAAGWVEVVFSSPFVYTGGNIL